MDEFTQARVGALTTGFVELLGALAERQQIDRRDVNAVFGVMLRELRQSGNEEACQRLAKSMERISQKSLETVPLPTE